MVKKTIKIFKVGTINKGKFRSSMQSGTGVSTLREAQKARNFFQKFSNKKIVIRKKLWR